MLIEVSLECNIIQLDAMPFIKTRKSLDGKQRRRKEDIQDRRKISAFSIESNGIEFLSLIFAPEYLKCYEFGRQKILI